MKIEFNTDDNPVEQEMEGVNLFAIEENNMKIIFRTFFGNIDAIAISMMKRKNKRDQWRRCDVGTETMGDNDLALVPGAKIKEE